MNTHTSTYSYLIKKKKYIWLTGIASLLILFSPLTCDAQGEYKAFKYDNGNISSEGYMVDGKPEGYWKTYYPDGRLKSEGNRQNFELDSLWIFYNEEGEKVTEITYRHGKKDGPYRAYKNGVLYEKSEFEKDIKIGESLFYYPTGELHKRIQLEDGKEHGEAFEYDREGRIITLMAYKEGFLRRADKVNRFDNQGKRRGPWVSFHPNGVLATEGYYMNDLKNGIFKTFDKRGDLVSLEKYREGELVTDSEESVILDIRNTYYADGTLKSTGGYVDGVKEGTHRTYDRDGNIISGKLYQKGEVTGEGIIDRNGDYQGIWKLYYKSGELRAEGEYSDSKRTGDWVFYHRNGETEHRAKYLEGLPHGKWTWYYDNGKLRREEFFRRGKEDGTVTEYDREGNIIVQGDYISGFRDGPWFLNVGDHIERGKYTDGERTGEWIYEYTDGTVKFEGDYVAGLAVGKHRYYHPNGRVKLEGKYKSGLRVGTWRKYDEEGVQLLNLKYKAGREVRINGKRVIKAEDYVPEI